MRASEIIEALEGLPGTQPTRADNRVSAHVPAIDDTVLIDSAEVARYRRIWAPNGDPAVEFVLGEGPGARPLIITASDVVYQPVSPREVLSSGLNYHITDLPHLVSYAEMEDAAQRTAREHEEPGPLNIDSLGASYLAVRCFIVAATLNGLRPVRSVAWWQRGWDALGGDLWPSNYRADPVWDELAQEAAHVELSSPPEREDGGAEATAHVDVADFRQLEPALTAVGLDEDFASRWRATVPITPARFANTLLNRVDHARAHVALYPDGGGSVDVEVRDQDSVALLQFSWSDGEEVHIDEVRITGSLAGTGLFQRLIFNTERLTSMMRFKRLTLMATEVGAYAFASMGYPRDPELHRAMLQGFR
ncbi:hypothetical protein ABT324_03065 [Saccharopolyspora sp. NPDC000359]|uniref:hypothetical protein n=1 Tax=Saccharopolyspora sp. NPDC000359 TaxID=3154251 RepID=UPI00332A6912